MIGLIGEKTTELLVVALNHLPFGMRVDVDPERHGKTGRSTDENLDAADLDVTPVTRPGLHTVAGCVASHVSISSLVISQSVAHATTNASLNAWYRPGGNEVFSP